MKEKDNKCENHVIFSTDFRLIPVQDIDGRMDQDGNVIIDLIHSYKENVKIICGALTIKADSFERIMGALNKFNLLTGKANKTVN
jgi:hypothetical protein